MLNTYRLHDDDWDLVVVASSLGEALTAWRSLTVDEDSPEGEDPSSAELLSSRVVLSRAVLEKLPAVWRKPAWDSFTDGLWDRLQGRPRPGTLDALRAMDEEPGRLGDFLVDYPNACLSRLVPALEDAKSVDEAWGLWRAHEEHALDGADDLDIDASHVIPCDDNA